MLETWVMFLIDKSIHSSKKTNLGNNPQSASQQAQTLRASCRRGKLAFPLLTINPKRTKKC